MFGALRNPRDEPHGEHLIIGTADRQVSLIGKDLILG
jgi:hypothetical protein